jgi:hypothetical protein
VVPVLARPAWRIGRLCCPRASWESSISVCTPGISARPTARERETHSIVASLFHLQLLNRLIEIRRTQGEALVRRNESKVEMRSERTEQTLPRPLPTLSRPRAVPHPTSHHIIDPSQLENRSQLHRHPPPLLHRLLGSSGNVPPPPLPLLSPILLQQQPLLSNTSPQPNRPPSPDSSPSLPKSSLTPRPDTRSSRRVRFLTSTNRSRSGRLPGSSTS